MKEYGERNITREWDAGAESEGKDFATNGWQFEKIITVSIKVQIMDE